MKGEQMNTVIEVNGLRRQYGNKVAVDGLSFQVNQGEVFGLLGHNGAGKSTTINCLLGLKSFEEGSATVLGMKAANSRKQLFERVGVQLQQSCYQDRIKVEELCQETAALYKDTADYQQLLEEFSLSEFKKQYVSTLSGGEKQKLSVLLALISKPEVIFLDELTEVWKKLRELKEKGVTILLTSHYMDEVEALCDRICILQEGKEIVSGTVKEVIASSPYECLEEAYLWYMGEEVEA